MSVCFGVIVHTRVNQRCACVSSGILMRSAPCDPGVFVLHPLCRSTSCAGFSDGVVPRRLCGQEPLHLVDQLGTRVWHFLISRVYPLSVLTVVFLLFFVSLGWDYSVEIVFEDLLFPQEDGAFLP